MPLVVVQLADAVTTSGGTNSTTIYPLDDANNIMIGMTTTTTSGANAATVQIEPTDTGTRWVPLTYGSSGQSAVTVSSSGAAIIGNVGFKQIRLVATGAMLNGLNFIVAKQISV